MSKINDGGPAFPVVAENGLGHISDGMTLRDWFAGQALAHALSLSYGNDWGVHGKDHAPRAAAKAYAIADAMIAESQKNGAA